LNVRVSFTLLPLRFLQPWTVVEIASPTRNPVSIIANFALFCPHPQRHRLNLSHSSFIDFLSEALSRTYLNIASTKSALIADIRSTGS